MKKNHRFLAAGLFAILVTGTAVLMRVPHDPAPGLDVRAGVPTRDAKPPGELPDPEPTVVMDAAQSGQTTEVAPPEIGAWAYEKPREPDFSKLAAFDNWIARWKAATLEERQDMIEEGSRLAGERRPEFKALISYDPRRALQEAVPRVVRQDLPAEILKSLESPISTTGDYTLFMGLPKPGLTKPEQKLEFRTFEAKDGTNYRAYVFGEMEPVMWKKQMPVSGVAIDGDLAVAENPVRKLEVGERIAAGTKVEEVCPVSGDTTMAVGSGEPVTEEVPTVQIGERVITLCDGSHVTVLEDQYRTKIQASGPGGAGVFMDAFPGTSSRAIGNFRCLYIRLTYPDQLTQPNTEGSAYADMQGVARYYLESSYGKMTTTSVVTPLVTLPHSMAWYLAKDGVVDGLGLVHSDAVAEARRLGYDSNQYDCTIVRVNGGPKLSGASWGGGNRVWVSWDGMDVLNHECGHSLGLNHANYWISTDGTGYGNGANQEYGNPFDVMGGGYGYSAQYNTISKRAVGWLPAAYVHQPQTNGVFRLYAYDQPRLEEGKRYALSVTKDSVRKYNVEFHPARGGLLADSAMVLYSGLGSSAGHLLDLTPGSAGGKDDGGIAIGRTFSDLEADIHFTVVSKNNTSPPSLDVAYYRGPFPGNVPPTLSLGASATTISAGGNVTFTATASDSNGDPLAYRWEFDDGVVGTNTPVFTRSFANVAQITAMLTVSDMKGGTARRHVVINVGSHGKQTINGNVSWNAQPLPGVRITGGGKFCYTDTDGNYALSGVATGSQALTATLNGYTFTPQFTNPLPVVAGANTAIWTADNTTNFVTLTSTADATEGGGNGTFTLTRSGDISAALTVRTQPGGTAIKTTDYTFSPLDSADGSYRSFTIPAGQASLDITVAAVNDTLAEGPETITVQLASNGTYLSNNANVAVMTIQDNDTALPQVAVTATDWYATESATDPGVFLFSRTGSTAGALNLSVSWLGTALNGTDYTMLPSTLTIPAGQSSTTVNVNTIQDTAVEVPEDVVATINATPNNWVRLVRSGTLITGYRSTDGVNWSVQGSATVSMTSTVSMGLAVSSSSTSLVATATFDNLTLNGAPVSGLTGTNIGTVGLGGSMIEVGGGFTVRGSGGDIYSTADSFHFANIGLTGDGDLRARVTSLSTNATWTKAGVMIRETTAAGSKNCFMGIGGAAAIYDFQSRTATDAATTTTTGNAINTGAAYVCDMSSRTASVIVIDDDQASISVSVPDSSAAEAGPDPGVFLITRTGSTAAPLKVYYGVSGTALHGTDYAPLNGEVTIPAGSASAPVVIAPYDDDLGEPEYETVTLAVTTFNSAYTLGSVFSGTLNIQDNDDVPVVTVRLSANGLEGGANGNVYFRSTGSGSGNVTVNYTVSGTATAGSDYTALTGTVTVPASGTADVAVPITILEDAIAEPTETIIVTITPSAAYRVYNDSSATVNVQDNDSGASRVMVSTWNDAPSEQGTAGGRFYFSRNGSVGDLTVNYTLSGTATNGVDYVALPGSVLIPDGQSGADILVAPVDDALAEGTETVIISIAPGSDYSAHLPATATYNLADNDPVAVTVGFAAATGSTTEAPGVLGEYRDFPVNLSAASADTITVNYAAGGGTAAGDDVDWAFVNAAAGNAIIPGGMLTFPPGTTTQNIRIRVKNDTVSEPTETAVISLSNPYRASLAGGLSSHTLTITDGSTEPYSVRFATSATYIGEPDGTDPQLMAVLDRPCGATAITVNYTVGGTATAGVDYQLSAGTITFNPGEQGKTLPLTIIDDSIQESGETIVVTLASPTGAQIGTPATHTITLTDESYTPGIWVNTAGGSWLTGSNWQGGSMAFGVGNLADFSTLDLTGDTTVSLDGARLIGHLKFGDFSASHNWTLNAGSSGSLTLDVVSGSPIITVNNQTATITANLAGVEGFQKTGVGTLILKGANTYSGDTVLNQGVLGLEHVGAGYAIPANFSGNNVNSPDVYATLDNQFAPGAAMIFTGNSGDHVRFELLGTTQTLAGIDNTGCAGRGVVQHREMVATPAIDADSLLVISGGSGSYYFDGYLRNWTGTLGLTKTGTNTQTLAGGNITYTGGTTVNGGTLVFSKTGALDTSIANNATVEINSVSGDDWLLTSGKTLSGSGTWIKTGAGRATVSNAIVSASGAFQIQAGTLRNNNNVSNWSASTADMDISNGAILDLFADAIYVDQLTGSGFVQNGYGNASGQSGSSAYIEKLVIGVANGTSTFGGVIRNNATGTAPASATAGGGIQLEKQGTGTIILTGANTYTGTTAVSGGTLLINGSLANTTTTVTAAGTLGGTGTVNGAVTVNGTLAPGSGGIGTLSATKTLTLAGTASMEIGRTGATLSTDRVSGVTTLTYGGNLVVTNIGGDALLAGDTFQLFAATTHTGTFSSIALPSLSPGLIWETANLAANGTIRVGALPLAVNDIGTTGEDTIGNFAVIANDSDPDGDPVSLVSVTQGANGSVIISGNNVTYTPAANYNGTDSFTYTITDSDNGTATATVSVTVTPVNDAPTLNTLTSASATEDSAISVSLTSEASDADVGQALTFTRQSGPAWLSVASNGAVSGVPTNGDVGVNNFVIRVTDAAGAYAESAWAITVANTNDAPTFTADPITKAETPCYATYGGSIAADATDVDAGDTLTYAKVSGPAWLIVGSTGALSGTPTDGDCGLNSFTVSVTDTAGASATTTLQIMVTGILWTNTAGGSWTTTGNWSGGVIASGANKIGNFATLNLTANPIVTLDGARTIGHLVFGDTTPSHNWTLNTGTGGPLTLDVTSGSSKITVNNQTTTMNVVLAGSDGFIKDGGGTLTLTGANVYGGGTTLSAGTLGLNTNSLSATSGYTLNDAKTGASDTTLRIYGGFSSNRTGLSSIGLRDISPITVTNNGSGTTTLDIESNSAMWVNGLISINKAVVLKSTGASGGIRAGFMTISGNGAGAGNDSVIYDATGSGNDDNWNTYENTGTYTPAPNSYSGNVRFTGGTTIIQSKSYANAAYVNLMIPDTASVKVDAGSAITFAWGSETIDGLNNGVGGAGSIAATQAMTLTVGASNGNGSFSGVIGGGSLMNFSKTGTGTQTLAGASTYTGTTTVGGGTLSVTGSLGATAITVQSGGTLGGTGTLGGAVTVQSGGTLAPGVGGTGTLTLASKTLTLAGTTAMQIGRTGSVISGDKVTGITTVTYGGTLTVTDVGANALQVADAFRLFAATTYSGTFGTVTLPSLASGLTWNTSRLSTDGYISVDGTLPGGWTGADIGSTGVPGGAHYASGVYTLSGSGAAIGGTADAFQSVSQSLTGDGEIRARITSQTNTNAAALAGVMLRDGVTAGNVNATMGLTPSGFLFQARSTSGGSTTQVGTATANTAPNNWVRLTRCGSLITAYVSANGTTWTVVGSTSLTMGSTVFASLAVTSHDNAVSSTAAFDNVSVTPYPSPWLTSDLGTTGVAGRSEYFGTTHTLNGAGVIGGTADGLRFTYQTLSADGQIVARVPAFSNTGSGTRVGVMIRDTLTAGSKEIFIGADGSGAFTWAQRTATGGSTTTSSSGSGIAPNIWLKLVRSGNDITAFTSADGTTWNTVGTTTVTMASSCYVGLAVGSGNTSGLNASSFDNVTVTP